MKGLIYRLSLVAAAVLFLSVPVRGDVGTVRSGYDTGLTGTKDECLLVAKNCETDSLQERILRLEHEIKRGTDVYSRDELKEMERQLDFYNKSMLLLERDRG
jgi:hypothetical protein